MTICFVSGLLLLAATGYGESTYDMYKRTISHIQSHGKLGKRFGRKVPHEYCDQIGFKIALKDLGIEQPSNHPATKS
ncbi:hypothetical protein MYX06_01985 [Patescibacteria group bacterium AH-259-L05]|nr:hypothetical protein [Patescibacteria group bacterium AH-259-L05]